MSKKYEASLQADCRQLDDDVRKIVLDAFRSGIKNEHGFKATKGLTDSRLEKWPVVIRFTAPGTRESFKMKLTKALHPKVLSAMSLKYLKPSVAVTKPIRWAVNM